MVESRETRRSFLSRAAFLRREMQGRESRRDYLRINGDAQDAPRRLIYIFDTSVVVSYCAPWLAGPLDSDGRNGGGVVFPPAWASGNGADAIRSQLDRIHATLVLKALAEFALIDASDSRRQWNDQRLDDGVAPPRQPILMFPAHYAETGKIYRVVAERARNQGQKTGPDDVLQREVRLATNALALLRSTKETYDADGEVSGRALSLVNYLIDRQSEWRLKGTVREWDRYVRLSARTGGIYSAKEGARFFEDIEGAQAAFDVLDRKLEYDEDGLRRDLVRYWRRQLDRQKSSARIEHHHVDAEALADLFLINNRLANTGANARVVFVTGDENLVRATYGGISLAKVSLDEPRLRDFVSSNGHGALEGFSQQYVSHLWGYIGEALAARDADREGDKPTQEGLADFFNGLLAKGAEPTRFPPSITERIAQFPEDFSDLVPSQERINQALEDWIVLSRSAARQSSLREFAASDELRRAILEIILRNDNHAYSWNQVLVLIQEQIDREQDRLTTNLSDTGIGPLLQAGLLGARNPPDLHFSSFPKTQLIFDNLARAAYRTVSQFERDFAQIRLDCHIPMHHGQEDDRQLAYLKYVVLGAAFASADKWSVALEHALMAAAIPERQRPPIPAIPHRESASGSDQFIAGREAYFLAAVAQRIIAESGKDFDKAGRFLNLAESALLVGKHTSTVQQISAHLLRIEGERFSLSLSEYYFSRSKQPDLPYSDMFNVIVARCRKVLKLIADDDGRIAIGKVARTSIATNVIQTAVISTYRAERVSAMTSECPEAIQTLPECLDTIKKLVKLPASLRDQADLSGSGHLTCSNLMAAYFFAGALLTGDAEAFPFIHDRKTLDDVFQPFRRSSITSYDAWRCDQLYTFCKGTQDKVLHA